MAEQIFNVNCGFFDSINQDRLYTAEDMIRPYKNIISNGVFATSEGTPSNKLQVLSANDGMNIIVKAGDGIFADKWFENPSDLNITVPSNANIVGRYDSVIVQVDKRSTNRTGSIVYREGIAASDPVPPAINDVDNVIEYRIANIYVAAGASNIGQENISDLRGSKECPWVTSLIQQVDTSTLYEQYRAAYQKYYDDETELFNAFMRTLTEQLTVYTSIIKYESNFVTTEDDTTEIPINITNFNKDNDVLMVKINKLFASEEIDYTISEDGLSIILTKPLEANQSISFLVLQSVVIADAETIVTEFEKLAAAFENLKVETENEMIDSGTVVSPTEPTGKNRKKVWMQKGKNLFDKNNMKKLVGYIDGAGNFNVGNTNTRTLYINCMPNTNYVVSRVVGEYFKIASFSEEIKDTDHMINGKLSSLTASELTINTGDNAKYLAVTYYNGGTDTLTEQEILDSLQIEQGTTATEYEEYIEQKIYVKNDNGVYEEFMKKEDISELIITENFTSSETTVSNNSYVASTSFDITKTDYTPIGIVMVDTSNNNVFVAKYSLYNNTAYVGLLNYSGNSQTTTVTIRILYRKN